MCDLMLMGTGLVERVKEKLGDDFEGSWDDRVGSFYVDCDERDKSECDASDTVGLGNVAITGCDFGEGDGSSCEVALVKPTQLGELDSSSCQA